MKISVITATRNRPKSLIKVAATSLLRQTEQDFEWVIVNDGGGQKTREAVRQLRAPFKVTYEEINHSKNGFGMCHARNKALQIAAGSVVAYLDDDNDFYPDYITETANIFERNLDMRYYMCQQLRRRDVVEGKKIVRRGQEYTSPSLSTTATSLIKDDDRFDSNGFAHYRQDALAWDPSYNLLADFEFFL